VNTRNATTLDPFGALAPGRDVPYIQVEASTVAWTETLDAERRAELAARG